MGFYVFSNDLIKKMTKLLTNILRKLFLAKDYVLVSMIVVFITFLLSSVLSYIVYSYYEKNLQKKLETTALRINNLLSGVFDETSHLMFYVSKQIEKNSKDLKFIEELLKSTSSREYKSKELLSWSLFDWVGPNNLQLVNRKTGIATDPPNMSHRNYTQKSRTNPWTLQLSFPTIGHPSNMWVIPAGMGITDKKGNFLGILVVGFNIIELTTALEEKLLAEKISFIVLDDHYNIVLQSSDNNIDPKSSYYKDIFKRYFSEDIKGVLENTIKYNNIFYSYYEKIPQYQYTILTGIDKNLYYEGFFALVLPIIINIFSMGLFFLLLLYFYRKKLIKIGENSDRDREEFIILLNQKLQTYTDIIIEYSNILLQFFKGKMDINIDKQKKIEVVSQIYESALNIQNFSTNKLELTTVDINAIIKRSVSIHTKNALKQNVDIKQKLDSHLLPIEADGLRIKQIILGLISSSLELTPFGGNIWISTQLKKANNEEGDVVFTIKDNGFGLSEEDKGRIKSKFDFDEKRDGINIDFESIVKLIELHDATYTIQNAEGKGRVITVTFPYQRKNKRNLDNSYNVVLFSKK
jgi:hypothetical protein